MRGRLVGGTTSPAKPDAVILHPHHAFAVRMIERNFDALRAGVFGTLLIASWAMR